MNDCALSVTDRAQSFMRPVIPSAFLGGLLGRTDGERARVGGRARQWGLAGAMVGFPGLVCRSDPCWTNHEWAAKIGVVACD